jgi:hypothetical protein
MLSTFEIATMILLAIGLMIAIWWYVIAEKYSNYLKTYSYSRGAHAIAGQTAHLSCDGGKEICVFRATQICTNPDSSNVENPDTDPIASGNDGVTPYGAFNPNTTVSRTKDMGDSCNGKTTASFAFNPVGYSNGGGWNCGGTTQLIATYTCIPKGTTCQSST